MIIKTIQWNIGGGGVRGEGDDPVDEKSYKQENLDYIKGVLEKYSPDIIFLQETHQNNDKSQVERIADALGLKYFFNDIYAQSHIDSSQKLGQGIISRWPIENHGFEFFINPKWELERPDGGKWTSHDKGVSSCTIKAEDRVFNLKTLHLFPFRKFGKDPIDTEFKNMREDIEDKIRPIEKLFLLQGDFNYNESSLKDFLPNVFENGAREVLLTEPTTPKGRKYDHVVYQGLKHRLSKVISDALTDHYPIYSEFEI